MNMIASDLYTRDTEFMGSMSSPKQGVVAVVCDDPGTIESLSTVLEFLDVRMQIVSSGMDFENILREYRPMAVISDIDCKDQDGFHVMKEIARYNRDLPILLLAHGDPVLMGAADAMQDLCGLTSVTPTSGFPMAGQLVAFLFSAGRRAGCMRLVPI